MQRATLVVLAIFAVFAVPRAADAELSEELKTELKGYIEKSIEQGGPEAKRAALLAWGRIADESQREEITEYKTAEEPPVRLAAGLALWESGDEEALEFVVDQLTSRSNLFATLRDQITVLPDEGERALLKRLVSDGDAAQQKAVFRYLALQYGSLYELLGTYLVDDDKAVRERALAGARHTARPAALRFVESKMLKSPEKAVQVDGIELAIRVSELPGRTEASVETLKSALGHSNSTVVERAAIRLLELHDQSGVEPLLGLLDSLESVERRVQIARALLENDVSPPPKKIRALYKSAAAGDEGNGAGEAEESEEKTAKSSDELERLYLELAVASGDEEMFEKAEKMFGSTTFDERLAAAKALGRTDRKSAVEMLGKGLFEGNPEMRLSSARSLRQIASERALPALKRSISQERDKEVKLQVVRALGAIGTPDALRILRFNSRTSDPEIRKAIIAGVRDAKRQEGMQTLRLYVNARDREIQWETFLALLEIDPSEAMKQLGGVFRNPPDGFMRDVEQVSFERQKFLYPKLLIHETGTVRSEAVDSAKRIGGPMFEFIRDVAFDEGAPKDVRTSGLRGLSERRASEDQNRFEKLVRETSDDDLKRLTAWTLSEYGDASLEATFRGWVAKKDPTMKAIGTYGLARIKGVEDETEE